MAVPFVPLLEASITLASEFLKKRPDYDQKKKEQFLELREKYDTEKNKPHDVRADNVVDTLRDELVRFIQVFSQEVSK